MFDGQRVLVTGGAKGLGRAIAERLAALGAEVLIGDIDSEAGANVSAVARSNGKVIEFHHLDVTNRSDWDRLTVTLANLGGLDMLVNNAGILICEPIATMSEETLQRTFDVNVKGVLLGLQTALPLMTRRKQGRVVTIASTGGFVGSAGGYAAYSASKAAVLLMSKCAAIEWADQDIRLNCICPSAIPAGMAESLTETDWAARAEASLLNRTARIGDVVDSVIFLLSEQSAYITGTEIIIDGGTTAQTAR